MRIIITNLLILLSGGIVAAVLTWLYGEFGRISSPTYYRLKRDIYKYKCQNLHNAARLYYLNLIKTNPLELAYDLASKDLKIAKKQKRVNELYAKLRENNLKYNGLRP